MLRECQKVVTLTKERRLYLKVVMNIHYCGNSVQLAKLEDSFGERQSCRAVGNNIPVQASANQCKQSTLFKANGRYQIRDPSYFLYLLIINFTMVGIFKNGKCI